MEAQELRKTTELVRLKLQEHEIPILEEAVSQMLEYFARMDEIKVDDLAPTTYVLNNSGSQREDVVRENNISDLLLDNAPGREGRFFTIPKVM